MKPFVRFTALFLAILFLTGAGVAWFDVLTHENILTNPELKTASGWLMTGLMLLALGIHGWRRRREQIATTRTNSEKQSSG
jgi:succinate dehydrogenase hydrophobic anchor subunit